MQGIHGKYNLSQSNTINQNIFVEVRKVDGESIENVKDFAPAPYEGAGFVLDEKNDLYVFGQCTYDNGLGEKTAT
ncbi:hypothetical protein CCZ01_09555 [Helicobacter monodelphidis]|uniref:hypothetical protein n=1 Tax=Helicobacter sp. 15-1451 TaxID=2004995 RepID=UPI000DCE1848|nr:hypothetical protein [Helicobacter sp. 15-1451]RAX56425.1 hypothetical protein CCZ01_09555 [Helicobacter sp. 15-1451]